MMKVRTLDNTDEEVLGSFWPEFTVT